MPGDGLVQGGHPKPGDLQGRPPPTNNWGPPRLVWRGPWAPPPPPPITTSAIPARRGAKPPGVPCVQLDAWLGCKIFGQPERPAVCSSFRPMQDVCGSHRQEAVWLIGEMERLTA